jgi:aryl-alcohol dehydrogenase-like predicted oxidoreductase
VREIRYPAKRAEKPLADSSPIGGDLVIHALGMIRDLWRRHRVDGYSSRRRPCLEYAIIGVHVSMQYRMLGRTGFEVSTVGFGAWAIGGTWGQLDDAEAMRCLHRALDLGVNFFDTADVYGDGHSERLLARLRRERRDPFWIATKVGRRSSPHDAASYTRENLTRYVERCLENLEVEALDLVQLHCPPTDVYYMPEVFGVLDDLVKAGKIRFYGASVERVEEGLKALEYPALQTLQVIFNILRQRPAELLFPRATERKVGILARLPLSSGMLTGKMSSATRFHPDDHRAFNREGAAFDKGETFSGFEYERGLGVVEKLRALTPPGMTLPELALRYIASFPAVTCSIPGARRVEQVEQNIAAGSKGPLDARLLAELASLYSTDVKPFVHQRW